MKCTARLLIGSQHMILHDLTGRVSQYPVDSGCEVFGQISGVNDDVQCMHIPVVYGKKINTDLLRGRIKVSVVHSCFIASNFKNV